MQHVLNFKGLGFINRMTDLDKYCESRGVEHMVVGDLWFERKRSPAELREGAALATGGSSV